MKNPFMGICRRLALRSLKASASTSLLPLKEVKGAMACLDTAEGPEAGARVKGSVQQFFDYHGIPVRILQPSRSDLDLIGRPKRKLREELSAGTDLFICLSASPEDFTGEYLSRSVPARFKVGCRKLEHVYDLVVAPPEGGPGGQAAAFAAIRDLLVKIR